MTLLLAILSVLAAWTLLGVLIVGLFLIYKTLESVRGRLEKIAWGVRAIEQQTAPLGARADAAEAALLGAGAALGAAAVRFAEVDHVLDVALPTLGAR